MLFKIVFFNTTFFQYLKLIAFKLPALTLMFYYR